MTRQFNFLSLSILLLVAISAANAEERERPAATNVPAPAYTPPRTGYSPPPRPTYKPVPVTPYTAPSSSYKPPSYGAPASNSYKPQTYTPPTSTYKPPSYSPPQSTYKPPTYLPPKDGYKAPSYTPPSLTSAPTSGQNTQYSASDRPFHNCGGQGPKCSSPVTGSSSIGTGRPATKSLDELRRQYSDEAKAAGDQLIEATRIIREASQSSSRAYVPSSDGSGGKSDFSREYRRDSRSAENGFSEDVGARAQIRQATPTIRSTPDNPLGLASMMSSEETMKMASDIGKLMNAPELSKGSLGLASTMTYEETKEIISDVAKLMGSAGKVKKSDSTSTIVSERSGAGIVQRRQILGADKICKVAVLNEATGRFEGGRICTPTCTVTIYDDSRSDTSCSDCC